ncbi:MAG: acyl-CoA dehydrogenase family protein [Rhodocyclaceae bacterium]
MNRTDTDWPFFDDAHRALASRARAWAAENLAGEDEARDVRARCRELVRRLGTAGWLRYCVPGEYGGALPALDARALCLLRETFAYRDALADFSFAMQGLGSGAISLFGSAQQRRQWLPRVAAGEAIAAFALSEPQAGSDVAAAACTATPVDGGYRIDGVKTWISNAGIADFHVVFARTGEAPGAKGLSAFIVEAGAPGLAVSAPIEVMAPHPLASLTFEDCRIGPGALIGAPGDGFRIAMATLDVFRSSVAAAALGFARRALDAAIAHARSRAMFGARLIDFQMTQAKLADMATAIDASALLTYRAAWQRDCGERVSAQAAMAKLHASESAQAVIDSALQLFGGLGVTRGNIAERLYREIRALRIYEGASEVQKLVIARELIRSESGS